MAERFDEAPLVQRCADFLEHDKQLMPAKKLLVFDRFDALHELRDRFVPTLCKLKLNEVLRSVEFLSMSQECRDAVTFYYD
ncbi:hypothetical protein AAVH_38636 [Aphelenchoides avenae]|nr:hypothetical protein AAVH_38636 [Aphelenchus avenae]